MIVLGALSGGNMAVRKDGSGGFARALEKRYLNLGGRVAYRSTVQKILVEKDAYDAEKEKACQQVLQRLNDVWPGIKDQIEMTNVATPHTWWRYTRNRQGAFEGFAITDKIFTTPVKRTLPGLDHFVMAGQWVVPGGGVLPTLVSGKHAAMLLCRRDGTVFSTSSKAE